MSEGGNKGSPSSDAAAGFYGAVILLVNAALAWSQFRDHFSWGAMGIALFASPLVNCTMLFTSFLLAPADHESQRFYLSVTIGLPVLLILCQLALFFVIR
jgi:hypothetical protein